MSAGQAGIYVQPSSHRHALKDLVHHFTLFALHPSKPYVEFVKTGTHSSCQLVEAGEVWGWRSYLSDLQELYGPNYPGPFTIGVWWHKANSKVAEGSTSQL